MEYQPTATTTTSSYAASAPAPAPAPSEQQQRADYQQPTMSTSKVNSFPPPPSSSYPRFDHPVSTPFAGTDIRTMKSACKYSLNEYIELQKRQQRQYDDHKAQERLRTQYGIVVSDLQTLRREVSILVKKAESHRWRRWLLGGLVVSLIPIVRKIFRRSSDDIESTDTEHAFNKSRSLVVRILDSVRGKVGKLASIAFFVLAVLWVFQNEVSLRVARTVAKRLRRLTNKIERGEGEVVEKDLDVLKGWRWRVLLM